MTHSQAPKPSPNKESSGTAREEGCSPPSELRVERSEVLGAMRTILDSITDIAWMKDPAGRFVVVNEALADSAGRPADQIIGLTDFDLWPRELALRYRTDDDAVMASRKRRRLEEQLVGADGEVRWIETLKSPLVDDGGRVYGTAGVAREITSRRRQDALQSALFKIASAATTAGEMDEFYATIHAALQEITVAHNLYVALVNRKTEQVEFPYWVDEFDAAPQTIKLGEGLTSRVILTGDPLLYERERHSAASDLQDVTRVGTPTASWLGVPLRSGSEIFGALVVQSYDAEKRYTEADVKLILFVSGQIAAALTVRRQAESLRVSEERFRLAALGSNDGLWDWEVENGSMHQSERWAAILGTQAAKLKGRFDDWFVRIHEDDLSRVGADLNTHLEGKTAHFRSEHRLRCENGDYLWVLVRGAAVRDEAGRAVRMAGSMSDISLRKKAEERIRHDALHDFLTGLPNRALFADRLAQAISRAHRQHGYHYAVCFLDLDRFKEVNDTYGHPVGDRLLVGFAERLKGCLRTVDTVARIGGDEFTILLDGLSTDCEAGSIATRILAACEEPLLIEGIQLPVRTSIGIALGTENHKTPNALLSDADAALYRAKQSGRACYRVFDETMRRETTNSGTE